MGEVIKYKICLLIPYFGGWPAWIKFYLKTLEHNQLIDIIFLTDCKKIKNSPENVKYIKISFDDFISVIESKLDVKLNRNNYYKICEYRPSFGFVFSELLQGYDFWGYGDIDVVYGDIGKFINNKVLDKYEIITARKDFICGHFSIFKNIEVNNLLFMMNDSYKKIFQDEKSLFFDEQGITEIVEKFKKNTSVCYRQLMTSDSLLGSKDWELLWDNGRLYHKRSGGELMYFHFIKAKKRKNFEVPKIGKFSDKFVLNYRGFCINK